MDATNSFQRLSDSNGVQLSVHPNYPGPAMHPHLSVEVLKYLKILGRHKRLIIGLTLAAVILTGLDMEFLATRLYQAQAIITPVPPDQDMSQIGGGLEDMLGGGGGGLASVLMGTSDNELVSERDIAILNSFDFTNTLVKRYNVATFLFTDKGANPAEMTPWKTYERINGQFGSSYDYKGGNLELTFIDSSPERARQVLTWYLEALRERLRSQEVQGAAIAAKSLQEEISRTSDSLLQNQLYELLARQIQREKLAQVEADFAFKVIEPPVVPDARYSPHVTRSSILAGIIVLFLVCLTIVVREWLMHAHAHLKAATGAIVPLTDPVEHDDGRREPAVAGERIRLHR
jgi:hypothetical protein